MFGHDDKKDDDNRTEAVVSPVENAGSDSWQHPGPPPADDNNGGQTGDSQASSTNDFTASRDDQADEVQNSANADSPDLNPEHALPATDESPAISTDSAADTAAANSGFGAGNNSDSSDNSNDNLIDLKQEALGKLSPLIGHLDQSPEEKFRTLMMMIQASDDQSLIRQAYEAAQQIDDEKARAQALLDVVNEINYFTQNPKSE